MRAVDRLVEVRSNPLPQSSSASRLLLLLLPALPLSSRVHEGEGSLAQATRQLKDPGNSDGRYACFVSISRTKPPSVDALCFPWISVARHLVGRRKITAIRGVDAVSSIAPLAWQQDVSPTAPRIFSILRIARFFFACFSRDRS